MAIIETYASVVGDVNVVQAVDEASRVDGVDQRC